MDCERFKTQHCRSCELLDFSYEETIARKEKKLHELFLGLDLKLKPTVKLDRVEESRNKAKFGIFQAPNGEIQFGFYDKKMQFKILEDCPLHMEGINNHLKLLKAKLGEYNIIPYSLMTKKGELKYVIISKSAGTNEYLIRFVLRSKESLDRLKLLAKELQGMNLGLKVLTANIQPIHQAILEGPEEIVLTDSTEIHHLFGDVQLSLGPQSFFQVTPAMASELYRAVGEVVRDQSISSFLDLYCGVGAFSYFAALNCPRVLGVEISSEAISSAKKVLSLNKKKGDVFFVACDVEEFLAHELKDSYDAILVNPPRRGLNGPIINCIKAQNPRLILYSSCNSETLARDYKELSADYEITRTQIFDMFPYTEHFETLMIFSRKAF